MRIFQYLSATNMLRIIKKKKTGMVTTYRIADFVNNKLLIYVL